MQRSSRLALAVTAAVLLSGAAVAGGLLGGSGSDAALAPQLVGGAERLAGLLYVKHGRVGTRSEGPDYFLQTSAGDVPLRMAERRPWEPDYRLEYSSRRMVEVSGELVEGTLVVAEIHGICETRIPALPGAVSAPDDAESAGDAAGPRLRVRPVRAGGLVFVRHGRVGSRSEGPDYFLQTVRGDLKLHLADRLPFEEDTALERFVRRIVEVEGTLDGTVLQVTSMRPLCATRLPD